MLKKLLKGIDSIREYAMLIHTYIHTYIQGSRQKNKRGGCLSFKQLFSFIISEKGGKYLGGGLYG